MANGYSVKIQGLEGVLRNISRYDAKVADRLDAELATAADNVAEAARSLAPKHNGKLAAEISANTTTRFNKSVSARAPYAAYVEFGTGSQVFHGPYTFTASEQLYAKKFYVNGKGKQRSQAFLFPAFHAEIPRLKERIKQVLFP